MFDRFRLIEKRIAQDEHAGLLAELTYALIDAPAARVDMDHVWPEDEVMAYLNLGPAISAEDLIDYLNWQRDQALAVAPVALAA